MNEQIWWYLARSSGMVGWVMLTASVLWGIMLATDLFPQHRRPAWLLDLHRWLGGLTIAFVVVHLAALFADSYIEFGVLDLIVPFMAHWKPLPVALGVLAMWALVAVQLTSLIRNRLSKRVWRGIHLTSYGAFWLTSLHSTFAGTDRAQPLYLTTTVVSVAVVMFAALYRILNGRRRRPNVSPTRASQRSDSAAPSADVAEDAMLG